MKKLVVLSLLLALAAGISLATRQGIAAPMGAPASPTAPPQNDPELAALAWLEGDWARQTSRGLSIERWSADGRGGLVGESVVLPMNGTEEIQVEALLLVRMGADVFYIARPRQNEYPTGFRLVEVSEAGATFENPGHDFPQRIVYLREGPDAFTATIHGPDGEGGEQSIDFRFERR